MYMYDKMFRKIKIFKFNTMNTCILLTILLIFSFYIFFESSQEGFECKADELKTRLASSEKTLVLFYADWCGHCQRLEPVWDETTGKAKDKMVKRNVGQKDVDKKTAAENQEIMDQFNIQGFPTIMVFHNGKAVPYEGERTTEAFLQQLK